MRTSLGKSVAWFAREIWPDEFFLALGLVMLGVGCWQVSPPAGLIVPGAILVYQFLQPRSPFVVKPPIVDVKRGSK